MSQANTTTNPRTGPTWGVSSVLYAAMITTYSGLGALYAFMPAVGRELHIPDALVASTASASSLIWFLVAPLWSTASDRVGRKAIILVGCAGFAGSSALTALAIHIGMVGWVAPMTAFVAIVGSRCFMGLFGFSAGPASQAYVADHTSPENRTQALSMLASAQGLGSILGPAAAPFMILPILGLAGPMFFFFVIGTAVLVAAWALIPADRRENVPARASQPLLQRLGLRGGFWGDPVVGPFVWCSLWLGAVTIVNAQVIGFMIIDLTGLPPMKAQVYTAYVLMGGALVSVLAQSA
ncbi:MAG: MFS transporter, partial [Phenylobacterium sp.]|uniref:MFS transporter n=1 Tax=Phenylobacterium sp. TaxID=1871053 RepID=UPI0027354AE5